MAIAITDDHRALAEVARTFLRDNHARRAARDLLDAPHEGLPPFWKGLCSLGWLGLHLPEEYGGEGYGLPELAVVIEELGRVVAPGPFLPTVLASAVIAASEHTDLLDELSSGAKIGALGLGGSLERIGDAVTGDAGHVLGAALADLLVLPVGADLAIVEAADAVISTSDGLDPTRRAPTVRCEDVAARFIPGGRSVANRLARTLASAEAAGIAGACTDMAVAYAKERQQFGLTIGTFQAVKHHAANMLVHAELATATAWDAARTDHASIEADLPAAAAASMALPAAVKNAEMNIQMHGGVGFTWEHDAHLYLRRANVLAGLLDAAGDADFDVAGLLAGGATRDYTIDLPPEAERYRTEARKAAGKVRTMSRDEQRAELSSTGYFMPHWPRPWGRNADAAEQLVIEEEFAGIKMPSLGITAWNILTIVQHGTEEQCNRWVHDALAGRAQWCQLFSEPAAGSDAAAIRTRGVRTEGGWLVSGQKVWTTGAHVSQWGFATVRTDSSGSKHEGVTMMAIDLSSEGVDVRPLREIAGDALFNEVFLDDVFVPDDNVVGEVGGGWAVARAVLGNEKVSIGSDKSPIDMDPSRLIKLAETHAPNDPGYRRDIGRIASEEQAMRLLNLRRATRAVAGAGAGPEGNVTKLLTGEHIQRATELALRISRTAAVTGGAKRVTMSYLYGRSYTIAGGTSEIIRNQIAERILGLPRDPLIK